MARDALLAQLSGMRVPEWAQEHFESATATCRLRDVELRTIARKFPVAGGFVGAGLRCQQYGRRESTAIRTIDEATEAILNVDRI